MKYQKSSLARKVIIIGFIVLVFTINLYLLFNINLIKTNSEQDLITEQNTLKTSDIEIYNYSYYKNIVIDHEQVEGLIILENFPVLISIIDSDLQVHAQDDGDDIVFFIGTTQLDHEIEVYTKYYSATQAQLVAWVRIPSLSGSADTTIRMQYGNPYLGPKENPEDVWNNDFRGVWHLSENPAGTIYDSTSNNIDGSSGATMNINNQVSGKIDGSLDFDGSSDRIDFGDIHHDPDTITISFWMNADTRKDMCPIDKFPSATTGTYGWSVRLLSSGSIDFHVGNSGWWGYDDLIVSSFYSANSWIYVTCVLSTHQAWVYKNGVEVGSLTITYDRDYDSGSASLRLGIPSQAATNYRYDGTLDEVRLSNVVRTSEWIKTEYNNYNNPNNFYTISQEFDLGGADFNIGVQENNTYVYELVEKEVQFTEFLPELHDLVDATYWKVLLNYTRHMDKVVVSGYGEIIPIVAYFEISEEYGYKVSDALKDHGYPGIKGIAEWYTHDINFGADAVDYLPELLYGTYYIDIQLPGLIGEDELGTGILEFFDLYNKSVTNGTLRDRMTGGYGITWTNLGILKNYYYNYFVPYAVPELKYLAWGYFPEIGYLDVMDALFAGEEVKGQFTGSKINTITSFPAGWIVMVDKWDFVSNKEDLNFSSSPDTTEPIDVYKNPDILGSNLNAANITLQKREIMPTIVDIYLNNITWNDNVKIYGNTITDIFYSGPIDGGGYSFDEMNLTYSITFSNDGMIKKIHFYGDAQLTPSIVQRITFYELSIFEEENNNDDGGGGGGTTEGDNYVRPFDSRVIVLSSITLTFGLGLFYVLKKSRGLRR